MRRVVAAVLMTGVLVLTGCAQRRPVPADAAHGGSPGGASLPGGASPAAAGDWAAGLKEAEVYTAVLRRYVETPGENSFPAGSIKTVYVLDRAFARAADPMAGPDAEAGVAIPAEAQRRILAALPALVFIADRRTVVVNRDGCEQVRDGGMLITLGPANGDDNEVTVGINGFVACLGATWLTYVVRTQQGVGWVVSGTTGPMAIA